MATDVPHASNSPAAWMDQLSDRLGSLIPGGYRLPPRHPVKVSLVMVLLGIVSGWAVGAVALITHALDQTTNIPIFKASGLCFGLLVVIPWLLWMNQTYRILIGVVVYSLFAAFGHIPAARFVFDKVRSHAPFGMTAGIMHASSGMMFGVIWSGGVLLLLRRFSWIWWIAFIVISAGASWSVSALLPNNYSGSTLWIYFASNLSFALRFMTLHVCAALCLGIWRWDWTPRAKFELSASERLAGSDA